MGLRNQSVGFTLIEVLVALALMAMIATILITSLQIGGHTWQRVTRATDDGEEIAQAQRFLRQSLSSLYPYERLSTGLGRPEFLLSNGGTLEFSAAAPASMRIGLYRYQLSVDSSTLIIRSRIDHIGAAAGAISEWTSEPLMPHVVSLDVQFLSTKDGEPARWVDRWTEPNRLPRLIRIDVAFAPKDPRRWPPFYVEPRINTAVTCAFDVVSRRCRSDS